MRDKLSNKKNNANLVLRTYYVLYLFCSVTRAGGGTSRKHYRSGVGRGGASGGRGGGGLLVMVRVK